MKVSNSIVCSVIPSLVKKRNYLGIIGNNIRQNTQVFIVRIVIEVSKEKVTVIVIQGAVRDIQKLSQLMYTFVSPSATLSHFLPLKDGNSNRDPLFW